MWVSRIWLLSHRQDLNDDPVDFAIRDRVSLVLGGFAAAVNWIVRFPLSLVLPFAAAVFIAYLIGMSVGFTRYRAHVFHGSTRPIPQQVVLFLTVNAAGAVIVLSLSSLLVALQAGPDLPLFVRQDLAPGIAIGVGAVFNFFGHRLITFAVARRGISKEARQARR